MVEDIELVPVLMLKSLVLLFFIIIEVREISFNWINIYWFRSLWLN